MVPEVSSAPNWTSIVSAVASSASAAVVLLGAFLARRYVTRATATVEAAASSWRSGVVIHVRPCIQSSGLARFRLEQRDDMGPRVIVTEQQVYDGEFMEGEVAEVTAFEQHTLVDPGESITDSLTILFSAPKAVTVGWSVNCSFAVRRRLHRRAGRNAYWWWATGTFVPRPLEPPRPAPAAASGTLIARRP